MSPAYAPHLDASKEAHENTYLSLLQWSYVPTALALFQMYVRL